MDRLIPKFLREAPQDEGSFNPILGGVVTALTIAKESLNGIPLPGVQAAIGGLLEVFRRIIAMKANEKDLKDLLNTLGRLQSEIIDPLIELRKQEDLWSSIQGEIDALAEELGQSFNACQLMRKGKARSFMHAQDDTTAIAALNHGVEQAIQKFIAKWIIKMRLDQLNKARQDRLDALPRAHAHYDSGSRLRSASSCLEGTRMELLTIIREWIGSNDPQSPSVFWLCGLAGTGKSTVAQTISEELRRDGQLGASFFFSRDVADRKNPLLVFSTLAHQLAYFHLSFKASISRSLERYPDAGHSLPRTQIDKLILEPLKGALSPVTSVVIVVDALDESDDVSTVVDSMIYLSSNLAELPFRLKIFITSRTARNIQSQFMLPSMSSISRTFFLHDIESSIVKGDITLYLHHRLELMANQHGIPLPWPSESVIRRLANRAGDLFIFAATVVEFISQESSDPESQLEALMAENEVADSSAYAELDDLYRRILGKALPTGDGIAYNRFRDILGAIVVLQEPLPIDTLGALLKQKRGTMNAVLSGLHAVISVPLGDNQQPIRLIHPSFADFLTSKQRSADDRIHIISETNHLRLTFLCLEHMTTSLKSDICSIGSPSKLNSEVEDLKERIERYVPPHLQYACFHWTVHLSRVKPYEQDLLQQITKFCQSKLLQWIEIHSLCGRLHLAFNSMMRLENYLVRCQSIEQRGLVKDCQNLLLKFYEPISRSALHIYHSALFLLPKCLLFQALHSELHQGAMMLSRRPYLWNPCIRTLYVDTRHVPSRHTSSLALSPDGRHLVSAHIGALRIWDVTAGTCLLTLHRRNVVFDKVMFSADGSLIVSTSHDNIIRFWKSDIGEEIAQLAHQNLPCIALTTDKKCLASGGSGMPVRLWDPESIEKVFEFGPASKNAQSLQFYSQNELVSLHENGTVHMWHFDSSDPTQSLNHFEVTALALSPKGDCFVGTKDGDIYRWSMKTSGKATRAHRFGSEIRDLVVIGVDDCIAAAVEDGRAILLGDNWNGAKLVPLAGHEEDVHSISFSPATNILASAADDLTIRIWYWHHGAQMVYPTTVDPCCIIHFVLSPDNSLIAVIRDDGELKLFTVEGQFHTSFDYHYFAQKKSSMVFDFNALKLSVKFSPNGLLFAFQSRNGSISICNVVERRKQTALPHQDEELRSIAFSSDNARLVSGSAKDVVRVWNINTAQCIAMWRTGEYGNLRSVGFSADGSSIGVKWSKSASICKTYWDANSYAQLQNSTLEEIVPIDSGRFFLEGGWICHIKPGSQDHEKGRRLCWIPEDYRAQRVASYQTAFCYNGLVVAVGTREDRILIIDFSKALLN